MKKLTIKANLVNLGAIRQQGFNKAIAHIVDDEGSWHSVFIATDFKTGEPRFARNGQLLCNVKVQRSFGEALPCQSEMPTYSGPSAYEDYYSSLSYNE